MPNLEIVENMIKAHEVDKEAYKTFKKEYFKTTKGKKS